MHPNSLFRHEDRALLQAMIDEIGFGMIFATTPDGPRVAHTPLIATHTGAVQFHLARGNALTQYLNGMTVLALVNGPDGYISPRWYSEPTDVPTWNYISLELEGPVRRLDGDRLYLLLEGLSKRQEDTIGGEPWTIDKVPEDKLRKLMGAIVGFELEVKAWRPTFKLSQNKSPAERARVADQLEVHGSPAIAALMRSLGGAE
jgi:transcriptional regulator